jgi:hypothetical protein
MNGLFAYIKHQKRVSYESVSRGSRSNPLAIGQVARLSCTAEKAGRDQGETVTIFGRMGRGRSLNEVSPTFRQLAEECSLTPGYARVRHRKVAIISL